jgi:hypothetical protein
MSLNDIIALLDAGSVDMIKNVVLLYGHGLLRSFSHELDPCEPPQRWGAMTRAIVGGHLELVKWMVANVIADDNEQTADYSDNCLRGANPLHVCVMYRRLEILTFLLTTKEFNAKKYRGPHLVDKLGPISVPPLLRAGMVCDIIDDVEDPEFQTVPSTTLSPIEYVCDYIPPLERKKYYDVFRRFDELMKDKKGKARDGWRKVAESEDEHNCCKAGGYTEPKDDLPLNLTKKRLQVNQSLRCATITEVLQK